MLEIGRFKDSGKIGKLKKNRNYVSGNDDDSFEEKLLKNILYNDNKNYKHDVNVLSLIYKFKEKVEEIEKMKNK